MAITYNNLYNLIYSIENLQKAWQKARKGKTTKEYVIEFEKELDTNIIKLHLELKNQTYGPAPLKSFVIHDPKTRLIHKSDFRDRIVHHTIIQIIEPLFDKVFIYDSYANRKGKGTLKAVQRFDKFVRKVSRNGAQKGWFRNNQIKGYCFKADIKKYFQTVSHEILLNIIKRKIVDKPAIDLINKIVTNFRIQRERESICQNAVLECQSVI